MKSNNFKVGDKVLFRAFISNNRGSIPTIKDFIVERRKPFYGNEDIVTDVTLVYDDGYVCRTSKDKIYKPSKRTIELFGKYKWDIKGVKQDNGYFGAYSCIEVDKKKAIVFCDDRDAIVHVVTDWYDDIIYGAYASWSGDNRWNDDKPIIVYDKKKGYNLNAPHINKLLCDEWLKSIEPKWLYNSTIGKYIVGTNKDNEKVIISVSGTIQLESLCNPKNIEVVLSSVKRFTKDEVLKLWIEKGLPCAHIRGLEYKGAKWGAITKEQAIELYKTHNNFNGDFNSAEWEVLDNKVTLLFRDYCNSDYD